MKKNELDRLNSKIQQKSTFVESLRESISEVIVGQNDLIDKILISIISNGHILLEGVPGLAKTLTINTCLLYTSPSPRDGLLSRMPSSA